MAEYLLCTAEYLLCTENGEGGGVWSLAVKISAKSNCFVAIIYDPSYLKKISVSQFYLASKLDVCVD